MFFFFFFFSSPPPNLFPWVPCAPLLGQSVQFPTLRPLFFCVFTRVYFSSGSPPLRGLLGDPHIFFPLTPPFFVPCGACFALLDQKKTNFFFFRLLFPDLFLFFTPYSLKFVFLFFFSFLDFPCFLLSLCFLPSAGLGCFWLHTLCCGPLGNFCVLFFLFCFPPTIPPPFP